LRVQSYYKNNFAQINDFNKKPVGYAINGNPKPELKEMTGVLVVKFIRRPASEGIRCFYASTDCRFSDFERTDESSNQD
jgi:hypothetical protein